MSSNQDLINQNRELKRINEILIGKVKLIQNQEHEKNIAYLVEFKSNLEEENRLLNVENNQLKKCTLESQKFEIETKSKIEGYKNDINRLKERVQQVNELEDQIKTLKLYIKGKEEEEDTSKAAIEKYKLLIDSLEVSSQGKIGMAL